MKKILLVVILVLVLYFIVPRAFYLIRYATITYKSFDYSSILSLSSASGYKGIILEKISFGGVGEIYLLQNNGETKSIKKQKLEYYKEVSIFQDKKRLDPLDFFVKNTTALTLSGDKNFIVGQDWVSGAFAGFIEISNFVNEPKIAIWESMRIIDSYGTPDFGPYRDLRNTISPNGQYIVDRRKGDSFDSFPYGLYKLGDVSNLELQNLYKPVPQLADPAKISQLFTFPVTVFKQGQVMPTSYFSFIWTENSSFLLYRPDPVNGKDLWKINSIDGRMDKITANFPVATKIITAISPEEIIAEYYSYISNGVDSSELSTGTYLMKINNGNVTKTKLLPNYVKLIGFVH